MNINWKAGNPKRGHGSGVNRCRFIVVHYAASGTQLGSVLAASQANNAGDSSWHYSVGVDGIWQQWDDSVVCYHCGYSAAKEHLVSNAEAIGIEVCNDGGPFDGREVAYLAELVPYLMRKHGIDRAHVVRHYDCTIPRKNCPEFYTDEDRWQQLLAAILKGAKMNAFLTVDWKDAHAQVFYFDGAKCHALGTPEEMAIIAKIAGECGVEVPSFEISEAEYASLTDLLAR